MKLEDSSTRPPDPHNIHGHLPGDRMSQIPVKNLWERLNNLALVRFLLLFASGWAIVQCFAYFQDIIVVFTFAAIVAFLLSYPVRWLRRFMPHGVAVSVVFLVSLLLLGIFTFTVGFAILSQGQQLLESVPNFLNSLIPLVERLESYLRTRNLQVDLRAIEEPLRNQALVVLGASLATSPILLTNLIHFILIEVVAFFMLLDGKRLWNFLLKVVPKHLRDRFTDIVQRNFLGYFRGQLLLSLFLSASSFIVFVILQVPFPLVLAAIAGVFDLIPGIGATLGIILICLFLLPQSIWMAIKVLITCIVLQQIQDNLIAPRVMQNSLNLNPVLVFFALLVGARIAGLLGVFLAIPIAGVVVTWFEIEDMKAMNSEQS
nr:AI-2E family transporter [Aerosakkonema funiforme]